VRREPGPRHFAVVVLAAVAFALKPYFVGIPALVEFYLLLSLGWRWYLRDPVPWVMATVWTIYLASLPILFPDYLKVVLPLISTNYLGGSIWQTAQEPRAATALVLLVPLLWIALRGRNALVKILSLAAVAAAASALVQRKGWSYHIVPIELFGGVLAGTLAARWLDMRQSNLRKYSHSMASALSLLLVLYLISSGEGPWREFGYRDAHEETEFRDLLIQSAAQGEPVLVLSPRIWPIYPALNYAHAHQTLRAMSIWVLQGAYRECLPDGRQYRDIGEMGLAERTMFQNVAEDFAASPPKVVVIDRVPGIPWCGKEFNLLEYFKLHPRFASTWTRYAFFAENNELDLYRRVEQSADISR
jgi:hypothetical protein